MVPAALVTGLRAIADGSGVSLGSVWLAAHAKVLAALSGEREVATGYVTRSGGPTLPLRMVVSPGSWRSLLREAHRAEQELLARQHGAHSNRDREPVLATPPLESVFDPTGSGGGLPEHIHLRADILRRTGIELRLEVRTDEGEARTATRIAGYHLAALTAIAADADAEHARQCLLSPEELDFQLHGLAGPARKLPDGALHDLFEARARAHPYAVAVVHGARSWSYRELNARANQLARALLARGLGREEVVAVVSERDLDWAATVLGIFKAGGSYLPIEPRFPSERIERMLARTGCRMVVTERGGTPALERALESLPRIETFAVDAIDDEHHDAGDLGLRVTRDQLAYVFFTPGSSQEPKGVMCEHAGMLNHVLAKVRDLGLGPGEVVAQTASPCFDASVWQLLSPLLAGACALLVEREAILDPARFVEQMAGGRVTVFQVLPSHLEVLLWYLSLHPRRLPRLRCVSVTGEALRKELVRRWFALQPSIPLVNTFGLTETSDETNHEIMTRPPDAERIPLGMPIQNVRIYIVDEELSPVPLGAPGEIVFSGVCVGRGYINDPAQTRSAFVADPHRKGERLYRSGEHGRWLPDGSLEFVGRGDGLSKGSGSANDTVVRRALTPPGPKAERAGRR